MKHLLKTLSDVFAPLRNRNFSVYLSGQTVSLLGTAMQATAQSWVVWEISHSTQALGITAMIGSLPMLLFGAFGGSLADKLNRRKILIWTQVISMALAFVFALLLQTNTIQVWHIYILAGALGIVSALDLPSQSAFVGDIAGGEQVRGAIALNGMIQQASRMVGPALAGLIVGSFGSALAFWLNGASFIAVVISLLLVHAEQTSKRSNEKSGKQMKAAFQYVGKSPRIADMLIISFLLAFFGISANQLLPAIVTDTLRNGAQTLGLITGASGVGALVSSFLLTPLVQRVKNPGWIFAGAMIWMGLWFIISVIAGAAWVWLVGMFLAGLAGPVVNITINGLIQVESPPEIKARMLSVWMMVSFGMMPFGALLVGFSGNLFGAPIAVVINGLILILGAGILYLSRPGLRKWQPKSAE